MRRPASSATRPTTGRRPRRCAGCRLRARVVSRPAGVEGAAAGRACRAARDDGARRLQELGLRALGDDPAVADHHDVVGDDLDLAEEVRGQQHRSSAGPRSRGAGPASSGCRPGRARWPARRGSAPQGSPMQGGGDAEPLAHAERVVADPAVRLRLGEADQLEHLGDATAGRPIIRWAIVRISRPVRPACWAEASSITPTSRPGFGRSANRRPEIVARPEVGAVRPTIIRIDVDLPAPFGPRKPVTRPAARDEADVVDDRAARRTSWSGNRW